MSAVTRTKLFAQSNAVMPRDVAGRSMYMASPDHIASYARHLIQAGAKIIGGCCGTTPEHIRTMLEGIRPLAQCGQRAAALIRDRADDTTGSAVGEEPFGRIELALDVFQ